MPSKGTPLSKIDCGALGASSQVTEDGPPEKITPFGRIRSNASAEVEPQISLGRVLDLLEGALPFSMRLGEGEVTVAEHPSGESFFGGSKELSDADAERLAREQLERCGLLRK